MVATLPRILAPNGLPFDVDPDIDAPLVGPSVLALVGGSHRADACHMWRVWSPFKMLQSYGYPAEWGVNDDPRVVVVAYRFQAILLCRLSWMEPQWKNARAWFDRARAAGRRIWYEADDDLFSSFVVQQQHQGIARETPVEQLEAERVASVWTMQQCDGVTVSTQRLATVVRQFTDKPVEVVPNAIDAHWFRQVQSDAKRTVPGLTIGWAGGNRPDGDLRLMAEAWGRIAKRYPHVTFVVYGHQPWCIAQHVPETRLKRIPWRPVTEYPLELVNIDIACCPLEDRHFNRCKTAIKAWEFGLSGSAVVASPTVYGQCIEPGENGLLAVTADEWEFHLSRLVEQADYRQELAAALKRDVLAQWTLEKQYRRWPEAWRRLTEA